MNALGVLPGTSDLHSGETPGWMHRRYPYGPLHLRLVTPIVAIVMGIIIAIRSVGGLDKTGDTKC